MEKVFENRILQELARMNMTMNEKFDMIITENKKRASGNKRKV